MLLLLRTMIYSATAITAYSSLDEFDQLYVSFIGLPLKLFGIWWFLRFAFLTFGILALSYFPFNMLINKIGEV